MQMNSGHAWITFGTADATHGEHAALRRDAARDATRRSATDARDARRPTWARATADEQVIGDVDSGRRAVEEETYFTKCRAQRKQRTQRALSCLFARTGAIFSVLRSFDWSPRDFFCQVINSDVEHRAYGQLD